MDCSELFDDSPTQCYRLTSSQQKLPSHELPVDAEVSTDDLGLVLGCTAMLDSPEIRQEAFLSILEQLGEKGVLEFIKWVQGCSIEEVEKYHLLTRAFKKLQSFIPDLVLAYCDECDLPDGLRFSVIDILLESWAETDVLLAINWLSMRTDYYVTYEVASKFAEKLLDIGPLSGWFRLLHLAEGKNKRLMVHAYLELLPTTKLVEVLGRFEPLRPEFYFGEIKCYAVRRAVKEVLKDNDGLDVILSEKELRLQFLLLEECVALLKPRQYAYLFEHISRFALGNRQQVIDLLGENWIKKDYSGVFIWLESLPVGLTRDVVATFLIRHHIKINIDTAWSTLSKVSDRALRCKLMKELIDALIWQDQGSEGDVIDRLMRGRKNVRNVVRISEKQNRKT